MSDETPRDEFERLYSKVMKSSLRISRRDLYMSKEDAMKLSDEQLLEKGVDPELFRAAIDARVRMEQGNSSNPQAAALHPEWIRSNANLQKIMKGGNHGLV